MRIQNKTAAVLGSNHNATIVIVAETIELLRVRYGQGLQHHRINECENRRGGSDAQGKREHNSSREARRFAQYAQTKAQILNEILNPIYAACVAAFLFGLLDPAQVESRAAVRLPLRHPLRDVFLGFSFEVLAQLVVQFLVRLRPAKQRPQPQWNRVKPVHRSHFPPLLTPTKIVAYLLENKALFPRLIFILRCHLGPSARETL